MCRNRCLYTQRTQLPLLNSRYMTVFHVLSLFEGATHLFQVQFVYCTSKLQHSSPIQGRDKLYPLFQTSIVIARSSSE